MSITVYVSIGNSDDKLTQAEWSRYVAEMRQEITILSATVHGEWFSVPNSPWQNACWCIEIPTAVLVKAARKSFTALREKYRQDSIAWAVATTEFL